MDILSIITITLFSVTYLLELRKYIHIYQLNHYKNSFQLKWIKNNILPIILKSIAYVVIFILGFNSIVGKIMAILVFTLISITDIPKESKKKLVYTNRVKRLFITAVIFAVLVIIIMGIALDSNAMLKSLLVISIFTPLLLLLFNLINMPINIAINNWYINDAKKIIKGMPNLTVIGITGSYGKTSVKTFLYKLLSGKYNVLIAPENYNTALGVTRTIRSSLRATHDIFVCEMGADQIGDIKDICDIVNPKLGVITSIGEQHLETFKSVDNIIKTKFELENSLPQDGVVFLNYDNEYIAKKAISRKCIKYGIENEICDFKPYNIKASNNGLEFSLDEAGNIYTFQTKLIGKHNVTNLAGAIAVARYMGVPMSELLQRVKKLECVEHRLQLIQRGKDLLIDDAYNSNPNGFKSALEALSMFDGIKIIITPGMIELGTKQYEHNYNVGKIAAGICDYIVLVGTKQTKPICDGIIDSNYDKNKLIIVEDVKDGLKQIDNIKVGLKSKIILIENDLPDNY